MGDTEEQVRDEPPEPNSPTISSLKAENKDLPEMSEREAYFNSLRLWIRQAQMYQNLTCFPYYMMSIQNLQNNPSSAPLLNNNYQLQGQPWPFPMANNQARNAPEPRPAEEPQTPTEVIARHGGYEYQIAPLHKRLIAELIDFILLFVLKLLVTFFAVDVMDFIDLDKFDFSKLGDNLDNFNLVMELTSELLLLEFMYRVLVCLFEACCLTGGRGRVGGATPGKALLGLRVVSASAVLGGGDNTVLVYPATPLSFGTALCRSLLKNLLISLLFPLCFVLFVFRYNRTGYDLLCNVIVVEESVFPRRRHAL